MNIWWPSDGSDEWLSKVDGMLTVSLLGELCRRRKANTERLEPILEVGVWKGAWTSVVLMNRLEPTVHGVDPYPALESVREHMFARLMDLGVNDRFNLSNSLGDLVDEVTYSMIHLDGQHTEKQVEAELDFAADHLVEDGIIVVDDFRNAWFPGVASALFQFIRTGDLKLFAVSECKAYLARSPYSDVFYSHLERKFAGSDVLPVWSRWRQWDGDGIAYIQPPDVCGQRVLLCGMR